MAHRRSNWALDESTFDKWFTEESALGHAHWNHTVVLEANDGDVVVEFKDFPLDLQAEAEKRDGYLPKYMRRITGAYLAHKYPAVFDLSTEDRTAIGAALADALGVKNKSLLEGRFHHASSWLEKAADKVGKAYGA